MVLSDHFARYTIVQPQDGATPEEELALARFQFSKIHGERAKGWEVRLSRAGGGARLACAIDASVLERLKACFPKGGKARLVSVQPALMAAYNGARDRIPREGAWLLLVESGRALPGAPRRAGLGIGAPRGGERVGALDRARAQPRRRGAPAGSGA